MMRAVLRFLATICYRCAGNPEGGCRDCGVQQTSVTGDDE